MSRRIAQVLLPMLGVTAVLLGLIALSRQARDSLRQDERYQVPFISITCTPPPGLDLSEFLAEVQYLANMPDKLPLLDEDLSKRLADGFARHPWVERVEEVMIAQGRVEVRLRYRTPVLAVPVSGQLRAVDARGILLPATANTSGLTVFSGQAPPPAGPAGTPWGDPQIEAAARAAAR